MFDKQQHILFINKREVKIYTVRGQEVTSTEDVDISSVDIKKLGSNIKILFADQVSYTIKIDRGDLAPDKPLRQQVYNELALRVPEKVSPENWDFVQIEQSLIAFVPFISHYQTIKEALSKNGIKVLAMESEEMAKTRHQNPVIGLAMKSVVQVTKEQPVNSDSPKEKKFSLKDVVLAFIIVVITLSVIVAILIKANILKVDNITSLLPILN